LTEYVRRGGKLVFGCRTGYKDMTGKCVMDKLPGLAAELTGADVLEYSFIGTNVEEVKVIGEDQTEMKASVFYEELQPLGDAKCEAFFASRDLIHITGSGALISHKVGEGTVYYYGSAFNVDSAKVFFEKLGVLSPWKDIIGLPEHCELAVREKDGRQFVFVLNYSGELDKETRVSTSVPARNMMTGEIGHEWLLSRFETLVLELPDPECVDES
ncbi:MAG: beta-galactosidase trimerization domain-containing protein, partial [Oscillospiraceae bacterium]|nr:beta-galactosidase trimerization domain-containing protein [Oscillospiraceae bacterium]